MCAHFVLCLCTPPLTLKKGLFAPRAMKVVVAFGGEGAKQWYVYWTGGGGGDRYFSHTPSFVALFFS